MLLKKQRLHIERKYITARHALHKQYSGDKYSTASHIRERIQNTITTSYYSILARLIVLSSSDQFVLIVKALHGGKVRDVKHFHPYHT